MNSSSLNEIAYSLLNEVRGGRSSNTDHIDLDQIKFTINYYRSTFIRRDFWKNQQLPSLFEQDLGVVDVGSVDSAETSESVSGEQIYRSTNKIPTPVRLKNGPAITYVGPASKIEEPIPLIAESRVPWQTHSKYTGQKKYATFRNGYIYIHNTNNESEINVRGVFEDPEQVFNNAQKADGTEFYDGSQPYPISADMLEGIKKAILKTELQSLVTSVNDDDTDMSQDKPQRQ